MITLGQWKKFNEYRDEQIKKNEVFKERMMAEWLAGKKPQNEIIPDQHDIQMVDGFPTFISVSMAEIRIGKEANERYPVPNKTVEDCMDWLLKQ